MVLEQKPISESEFTLFKNYIAAHTGITIPPEKSYLIETRLSKLMLDVGAGSFDEFYRYIKLNENPDIHQKIIDAITTNETLWFRDSAPWLVLEEILLPALVGKLLSGKKQRIRIWFSAVSTGQEAYSTVMCVDHYLTKNNVKGVSLSDFKFFATDISSHVLDIAKKGRYDMISMMRGINEEYKSRYFVQTGSAWDISPKIRDAVQFEHFNLMNDYHKLDTFDIIFCRYVLIYFSDALKKDIALKMANTLAEGGVFFTGNYALYDMLRDIYNVEHYGNLTYYKKKSEVIL